MLGDVLVKVAACGITHNELDWPVWTCRAGHRRTSIIPGNEVSGVVAALGYGTAGFAVGDEVFGLTDQLRDGAAAEYVAVEARNVAPKPRTVDHVHAAAVPRAGLTAWQALFDHGKLATRPDGGHPRRGRRGRIDSRPAGPLGRRRGDRDRAQPLPAAGHRAGRRPLHRARTPTGSRTRPAQADLVLDTIGGEVLARSPALLRPGGTLVTIKAAAQLPGDRDDIRNVLFVQESSRAQLDRARPPGRRGAPAPPGRRGIPARASRRGLQRESRRRHPRPDRPPALIRELSTRGLTAVAARS